MSDLTYRLSAKVLYGEGAEGAIPDELPDVTAPTLAQATFEMAAQIDRLEQRNLTSANAEPIELVFMFGAVDRWGRPG